MTNRELILTYQAIKRMAATEPSPEAASLLASTSDTAHRRGLELFIRMVDDGYDVPLLIVPGWRDSWQLGTPKPAAPGERPRARANPGRTLQPA